MTLHLWTGRLHTTTRPTIRRLDITRRGVPGKGPDALGLAFAPTETILRPALHARDVADRLRRDAEDLTIAPTGIERFALYAQADRIEADAWAVYEPLFRAEMRVSAGLEEGARGWTDAEAAAVARGVKRQPDAWRTVLSWPEVVLTCFCVVPRQRCHRQLVPGYLARIGALWRMPVIEEGELA